MQALCRYLSSLTQPCDKGLLIIILYRGKIKRRSWKSWWFIRVKWLEYEPKSGRIQHWINGVLERVLPGYHDSTTALTWHSLILILLRSQRECRGQISIALFDYGKMWDGGEMGVFDFEHLKDRARLYSVLTCSPEPLYCIWSLLGENYSARSNYPKPAMETVIIQSLLKVPSANSQSLRSSRNQARKKSLTELTF